MPQELLINQQNPQGRLEEGLKAKRKNDGTLSEDLQQDTNTGLSSSAVAQFIMDGFRPALLAENILQVLVQDLDGVPSTKIPISAAMTAGEIADDGTLAIQSSVDYSSKAITISMYGVFNRATYELVSHANVDLIAYELNKMGYYLGQLADSAIITAFDTATPSDLSQTNYLALGNGNFIDWDDILHPTSGVLKTQLDRSVQPTIILTNPTTYVRLVGSSPLPMLMNSTQMLTPYGVNVGGFRLIASNLVSNKNTYFIDPVNCGYFLRDMITNYRYRESGSLVEEMWVYLKYGVAVAQEESVFRIVEDTASD